MQEITERMAEQLRECVRDLNIAIEYRGQMRNPGALLESVHKANVLLAEYDQMKVRPGTPSDPH